MSAGRATLLSTLILEMPRCLLWGTQTDTCRSWGGRRVQRAKQRRHISPVAQYPDGLVKETHTSSRYPSLSLFPSREERSWSSVVWTYIPGLRTVSLLWEHTALPWPPHPGLPHLPPGLGLRKHPVHRAWCGGTPEAERARRSRLGGQTSAHSEQTHLGKRIIQKQCSEMKVPPTNVFFELQQNIQALM